MPWLNRDISATADGRNDSANFNDVNIKLHPGSHIFRGEETVKLEWNITKGTRRPDGVGKDVFLINDEFPGPTIEARSGDELQITVRNRLGDDGEVIAIHWHGLQVACAMDGVAGVTQTPIPPGESFVYTLSIKPDQAGTFWYHAHSETQRADGLFGALIVHEPALPESRTAADRYDYQSDEVLMIGDWYHRPAADVLEYYRDWKNFKIEPVPDSLLVNGRGSFNCSKAVLARPVDCEVVSAPRLSLGIGRTRLRLINTGASTGFSLSIEGYSIAVISLDGGNSVRSDVTSERIGIIYPGERVDVIIQPIADRYSTPGRVIIALDRENMRFPNLALTPTQRFPVVAARYPSGDAKNTTNASVNVSSELDLATIAGLPSTADAVPSQAESTVLLYSTISYLAEYENRPKGFINRTSWGPLGSIPSPLLELDRSQWPEDTRKAILLLAKDTWVEIVLNNMDDKGHPFHLHGHDFYVLAVHKAERAGMYGAYNPFDTSAGPPGGPLNLLNPLRKDTVYVPSMGYVVLRLKATEAGLWMMHCHVLWHQAVGMAMAFEIG